MRKLAPARVSHWDDWVISYLKAGGGNNNSEAMKKDDDRSNAMGVAKSTAELGEAQESSRKRCHTF